MLRRSFRWSVGKSVRSFDARSVGLWVTDVFIDRSIDGRGNLCSGRVSGKAPECCATAEGLELPRGRNETKLNRGLWTGGKARITADCM